MHLATEIIAEIEILTRYNVETINQGIKVHSNADAAQIAAVQRLYDKGLVSQIDGGYLTDLGRLAAEHAQAMVQILNPGPKSLAT